MSTIARPWQPTADQGVGALALRLVPRLDFPRPRFTAFSKRCPHCGQVHVTHVLSIGAELARWNDQSPTICRGCGELGVHVPLQAAA